VWDWLLLLYLINLLRGLLGTLYIRWRTKILILHQWAILTPERKRAILQVRECIATASTSFAADPIPTDEIEPRFQRVLSSAMWQDAVWTLVLLETQILEHFVEQQIGYRGRNSMR
jgi:hypothetical protein